MYMYIIDMRETNNCPRSRATMRNDLKFIGMHVNYFNYYTAVKGWSEYKGSLFDAELCLHRPESPIAN